MKNLPYDFLFFKEAVIFALAFLVFFLCLAKAFFFGLFIIKLFKLKNFMLL